MKLTTKARYAVTAMAVLALREGQAPTTLAEISEQQGISLSYLEQLFAALRRGDLVTGTRGPGGGYRLARPAAEISVAQVVSAVDGPPRAREQETLDEHCLTHGLWRELSGQIYSFLNGISLATLAQDPGIIEALRADEDERLRVDFGGSRHG